MPAEPGIRALLAAYAEGDPDEVLPLGGMLHGLGRRAFGMLLLIATLPALIPVPAGGAVSGPIVVLVGLQMLCGRHEPWLPAAVARRGPHRGALARFYAKVQGALARLERLVRPRLSQVLHHRAAAMMSGVLLVLLGLLLSLPIPFTNYLFAGLLMLFAFALLERDGVLMLVAWTAGTIAVAIFGLLSGNLAAQVLRWFDLVA